MLFPVVPWGVPQPTTTSSISAGSTPARSIECLTAWPTMATPPVLLNPPRWDLASPVRAVETMTASRIRLSLLRVGVRTRSAEWVLDRAESPFVISGARA